MSKRGAIVISTCSILLILGLALSLVPGVASAALAQQSSQASEGESAKQPADQSFEVTLLGTGFPTPLMDRFGPATLVKAGEEYFLFDCGRGATQRLYQLGVQPHTIKGVFLTHLHSDHVVGLPDYWLIYRLLTSRAFGHAVTTPMDLWGPWGVEDMARYLELAFEGDYHIRTVDERAPKEGYDIIPHTVLYESVVYDSNGVKITAFPVDHFPGEDPSPCFGYRVDYQGHSVVISGDTRYNENVVRYATGADVLVHEICAADPETAQNEYIKIVLAHHVTPTELGQLLAIAKPKLTMLTHVAPIGSITVDEILATIKQKYSGWVVAGTDLLTAEIGQQITVVQK